MKKLIVIATIVTFACAIISDASAQCSMCKAVVESNMKENENFIGKGLNTGILYLMSVPYILGAVGLSIYYFNRKKRLMNQ